MLEVTVKEAPAKLRKLLKQVEHGQHVLLTRRGKEVACLVPPQKKRRLPSLKEFRRTITVPGQGLSAAVLAARDEERY
jgi:prevent-host-death family protein